jgi:hypothetical protein
MGASFEAVLLQSQRFRLADPATQAGMQLGSVKSASKYWQAIYVTYNRIRCMRPLKK